MTEPDARVSFDRTRLEAILKLLERMASGDTTVMLPLSDKRDELDAISYAINVLSDELRYTSGRLVEAERRRFDTLLKDRNSARGS